MHIPTLIALGICGILLYLLFGAYGELIAQERSIEDELERLKKERVNSNAKSIKRRGA